MKSKFKALLRALPVMLLAATALTATVVPVSAATAPTYGIVGSSFQVTSTGVADAVYTVYFAQGSTNFATSATVTAAPSTGAISDYVTVPAFPKGTYDVWLRHATNPDLNAGLFAVTSSITLYPTIAAVGATVSVTGTGFVANPTVTISIDGTDITSTQISSISNGTFTASFVVPAVQRGNRTVTVRDQTFNLISATLGVTPGIATLTPATGNVGTVVTLTGGGFTPSASVALYIDSVDADHLLKTVTSTTNGTLPSSTTITIPAAARGNHNIIARDVITSTNSTAKPFTVSPKIILGSTSGAVGSQVTVSGTGFNATTSITFEFDGTAISGVTATTDAKGSFPAKNITIPTTTTSGTYLITAKDSSGAAEGVEFIVAARITLTPSSGTAGSLVTVQGNGFQTSGSITITYDDVVQTTATLTAGAFNASFTVPGGVAGNHVVKATDGINSALANYTATLSAALSPITSTAAPGNVGQELTVTGTGFLPNAAITVSFGTSSIGSATSSATGAFTVAFDAPAVAAGSHVITVTDGTNTRTFTFVMEAVAPAAPALVTPNDIEKPKQPVVYEWDDVTDDSGVTYTLEVFTNQELNILILKKEGLTTSSYTATELEKLPSVSKDAPYYWRVIATDGAGNIGAASAVNSFVVGFSISDLFPDDIPMWAWITIGVFVVAIIGGLIFYFYRRSYSY